MMLRSCLPALLLVLLTRVGALAQIPVEFGPGSAELSRQELTQLLQRYEEAIASPAYSGAVKDAARASAARIRERLEQGDFRVGDRVALSVEGEPNLPDTVTVEPGPQITLPLFGSISLAGVLRSEIQEHLTKELGTMIHDPVVHAKALMRLAVMGSVGNPGFYVVPADLLVSDAIMVAGGPGGNADMDDLRIERGSERILSGQPMQEALLDGRTLDQLNLQAGDQLYVPEKSTGGWFGRALRGAAVIASSVWLIMRVVH